MFFSTLFSPDIWPPLAPRPESPLATTALRRVTFPETVLPSERPSLVTSVTRSDISLENAPPTPPEELEDTKLEASVEPLLEEQDNNVTNVTKLDTFPETVLRTVEPLEVMDNSKEVTEEDTVELLPVDMEDNKVASVEDSPVKDLPRTVTLVVESDTCRETVRPLPSASTVPDLVTSPETVPSDLKVRPATNVESLDTSPEIAPEEPLLLLRNKNTTFILVACN